MSGSFIAGEPLFPYSPLKRNRHGDVIFPFSTTEKDTGGITSLGINALGF